MISTRCRWCAALAVLLLCASEAAAAKRSRDGTKADVLFDAAQLKTSDVAKAEAQSVVDTVKALHWAWLRQDAPAYLALLTHDVVFVNPRRDEVLHGTKAVEKLLPDEWEDYERPKGVLAMKLEVRDCELRVDGDAALVSYRLQITGGARWGFDEEKVFLQAFRKVDDKWRLAHQTSSAFTAEQAPFAFDFAYPVKDLPRAVKFYSGFLGAPESVGEHEAVFHFRGCRVVLDATRLDGFAEVEDGLSNGYGIIRVEDLAATRKKLSAEGVEFLTENKRRDDGDLYAVCADPAQNVFVLRQPSAAVNRDDSAKPKFTAMRKLGKDGYVGLMVPEENVWKAWLETDSAAIVAASAKRGLWIDAHGTGLSMERGGDAVGLALANSWKYRDRTDQGLAADLEFSSSHSAMIGPWSIFCYRSQLKSTGPHPRSETSLVTHVHDRESGKSRLLDTIIVPTDLTHRQCLELDYTGYPVIDLKEAERFYSNVLKLGSPYSDSGYRGYWSEGSVFGIYVSKPVRDGLPCPRRANGYASLWVRSAADIYAYLQSQGCRFPVIKSINTRAGVDRQPGYTQVLATDTEGNVLLFTEYTGK